MTALQTFGRSALRVTKNYSKGYSHTQIKVRNATCNDPWPPSGKEIYELAQMTYNQGDFVEIMEVIDKRLNDKGKNWRHVFKSLVVLDYLLHSGSENVILYCQENLYEIKTLREFQYVDDEGHDEGSNVRHKAVDIVNLLSDMGRLLHERQVRSHMHDRMTSTSRNSAETESESDVPRPHHRPRPRPLPNGLDRVADQEDEELQRALEESRRIAAQLRATAEDEDLQRAMKLSQEEDERRKRLVEQNAMALFHDANQLPPATTPRPPVVDASLPLQVAVQPQYTAMPPQYTPIQPQFTSYNPYLQQMQQEAIQVRLLMCSCAEQQLLQAQQTATAQQAAFSQQQRAQPLAPQPTGFGSRNPFIMPSTVAPSTTGPDASSPHARSGMSPVRDGPVSFNLAGTYEGREPSRRESSRGPNGDDVFLRPFSTGGEVPRRHGREREDTTLASLFANYTGDGVDTFGNAGQLRYGQTEFGRVAAQKTGSNNPFLRSPAASSSPSRPQDQQRQEQDLIEI
ncbi:hypothetical protein C8Q80DRAFT_1092406 [Daedaleopsis nitida]|nr:hypothetical protein C8Q80DRAFT_1092406 [Daedaleopsis nitida]